MYSVKRNVKQSLKELSELAIKENIAMTPCRYSLASALFQYGNSNLSINDILHMVKDYSTSNNRIKEYAEKIYTEYMEDCING